MNESPKLHTNRDDGSEPSPEALVAKNRDLVLGALNANISQIAARAYGKVLEPLNTQAQFMDAIAEFNALPAEERGHGIFDHSRVGTENIDRDIMSTTPYGGYPYIIKLAKDGAIRLETPLALT